MGLEADSQGAEEKLQIRRKIVFQDTGGLIRVCGWPGLPRRRDGMSRWQKHSKARQKHGHPPLSERECGRKGLWVSRLFLQALSRLFVLIKTPWWCRSELVSQQPVSDSEQNHPCAISRPAFAHIL